MCLSWPASGVGIVIVSLPEMVRVVGARFPHGSLFWAVLPFFLSPEPKHITMLFRLDQRVSIAIVQQICTQVVGHFSGMRQILTDDWPLRIRC